MEFIIQQSFTSQLLALGALGLTIYHNSLRRRANLHRVAIVQPDQSPWRRLLEYGDEESFLNLTGFDHHAFEELHSLIFGDDREPEQLRGRPNLLTTRDELGLLLFYCGSTMKIKELCLLFGITPTRCSVTINKLLPFVVERLKGNPEARIRWPHTQEEKIRLANLVQNREPTVTDVIGFTDGVALPIQCSSEVQEQASYYNGYHHGTMCNNVFCFSPEGKIISACWNYPGSWHDTTVANKLIKRVAHDLGEFKICVDQGFPRHGDLHNKFVGPLSRRAQRILLPNFRNEVLRRHNTYVSLRQSSEWGMRALQGTFTRLKSRLTSNKRKRKEIIHAICLLHNFRTHYVGLNQIATVFNPEYVSHINIENYDRIARYYAREVDSDDDDDGI